MSVAEAAAKHYDAYYATLALGKDLLSPNDKVEENNAKIRNWAEAFVAHFLPNAVTFGFPEPIMWKTKEEAVNTMAWWLPRYFRTGLGFRIRLRSSRIEVVSDDGNGVGSAICFVKYEYQPWEKSGIEPFDFDMVYGYRKKPDGTEGWEFCMIDGELKELTKRVPTIMS
jgi:hypothetical protein